MHTMISVGISRWQGTRTMDTLLDLPRVVCRGRSYRHGDDPLLANAAREFCDGSEEGTLAFFDMALPGCDRFIDFGAFVGFTSLYAATHGVDVFSFEPNPRHWALLQANLAANPDLAPRIQVFAHGVGARTETRALFAKSATDSGSSIYQDVERGRVIRGAPAASISLRDAALVLTELGIDQRTLLKIDIEAAEYDVLPAIAPVLARHQPWLHVSFHPFNIVQENDPYLTTVRRIRASLQAAEALASYPYMHFFETGGWTTIGVADRMDFLRQYLLQPKRLPHIGTPQYGFIDAVGFSRDPLPV